MEYIKKETNLLCNNCVLKSAFSGILENLSNDLKQKNKANFTDYFKKSKLRTSPKSPNGLTGRAGVIVQ